MIEWLAVWFSVCSVLGAGMAVHDKRAAIKGKYRVRESSLLLAGALGGALVMWLVMLVIHHKTRRLKFMLSLPLMALLHIAAVWLVVSQGGLYA